MTIKKQNIHISIQPSGLRFVYELSNLPSKFALSVWAWPGSFIDTCIISMQHNLWTITWACRGTPYKDLTLKNNISAFKVNAQKLCQKKCNTHKCGYMLQNYLDIPPISRSNV